MGSLIVAFALLVAGTLSAGAEKAPVEGGTTVNLPICGGIANIECEPPALGESSSRPTVPKT